MYKFGLNKSQTVGIKPLKASLLLVSFLVGVNLVSSVKANVPVAGDEKGMFTNWLDEDALRAEAEYNVKVAAEVATQDVLKVASAEAVSAKNFGSVVPDKAKVVGEATDSEKVLYAPTTGVSVADITDSATNQGNEKVWQPSTMPERKYGAVKSPWVENGEKLSEAEKAVINGDINAYLDFDADEPAVIGAAPVYGEAFGNEQNVDVSPITVGRHNDFDDLWAEREEAADWSVNDKNKAGVGIKAQQPVSASAPVSQDNVSLDFVADANGDTASIDWLNGISDEDIFGTDMSVGLSETQLPKEIVNVPAATNDGVRSPEVSVIAPVPEAIARDATHPVPSDIGNDIPLDVALQSRKPDASTLEIEPSSITSEHGLDPSVPVLVPQPKEVPQPLLVPTERSHNTDGRWQDGYAPFGASENAAVDKRERGNMDARSYAHTSFVNARFAESNLGKQPNVDAKSGSQSNKTERLLDGAVKPVAKIGNTEQQMLVLPDQIGFVFAAGSTNFSLDNVKKLKVFTKQSLLQGRSNADVILANLALNLQSLRFAMIRSVLEHGGFKTANIRPLLTGANANEVLVKTYGTKK